MQYRHLNRILSKVHAALLLSLVVDLGISRKSIELTSINQLKNCEEKSDYYNQLHGEGAQNRANDELILY